jgi:GntR family transcriptional regulator, hexuronate regulon transcriptional repressor
MHGPILAKKGRERDASGAVAIRIGSDQDSTPMTLPDTRKLYQQVASTIMGSIMSGKYKPGERLPSERDLAVAFKVSRPTIREAMIALEIRGLAETRHGSGIYVTDQPAAATNSADLDIGAFELTEARRLFEGEAAALAATQVSDECIEELERIIAEMEDENARGQQDWTADRRFHIAIARATRNTAIATVIENLLDMRHKSPLCVYMLERARRVGVQPRVSEHRRILVALRKHDPRAARNAMRDHLARVIEDVLAATGPEALGSTARTTKKRHDYIRRLAI